MPGDTTIEETKIVAKTFEDAGVDALNITTGWHESPRPLITREFLQEDLYILQKLLKKL